MSLFPPTASDSQTCPGPSSTKPSDVSLYTLLLTYIFLFFAVVEKATVKCKIDKDLATEIQTQIKADADLQDETAGWHVITGKSFASAITYQTKFVLFFDLLEGHHKSFLMFKTQ